MRKLACALLLGLCTAAYSQIYDDKIVTELWIPLENMLDGSGLRVVSADEYRQIALNQIQFVLSGIIYGFDVTYIPSDKKRNVAEEFTVSPLATIKKGDTGLKILATKVEENRFYIRFSYKLADFQQNWRKRFFSIEIPAVAGWGESNYLGGPEAYAEAVSDGIKACIREQLRPQVYNKPQTIHAECLLNEIPYATVKAGQNRIKVSIQLDVLAVEPYLLY